MSREHQSEVTAIRGKDWKIAVKSRNLLLFSYFATCLQEVLKFSLACCLYYFLFLSVSFFFVSFLFLSQVAQEVLFQWFRSQSRSYFKSFWYFPLEYSVSSCR